MNKFYDFIVILHAKKIAFLTEDRFHDYFHARQVYKSAKKMLKYFPKANRRVIIMAAWWHDVGRYFQDDGHEKLSAFLIEKELQKYKYDPEFIEQMKNAIAFHGRESTPTTLEGIIIRDVDKLEYLNVKRWKHTTKKHQYRLVLQTKDLLSDLRNKILMLEESKALYDKNIAKIRNYIQKVKEF